MKSKPVLLALLTSAALIGHVGASLAETCYTVAGSVDTQNVTANTQIGQIALTLSSGGAGAFSETGTLFGNITGGSLGFGQITLSHVAKFSKGNQFVTSGDTAGFRLADGVAEPTPDGLPGIVRKLDANGAPCSFYIQEQISNIASGKKFFGNVVNPVDVTAIGYISSCPEENHNHFDLSGEICVE